MSGCMAGDKPLVSIVMAVYKPRLDWLAEQLDSLNQQIYPNLELIICDDCPDCLTDKRIFQEHILAYPYTLVRNEQNLGSNKTFELLTGMAKGTYIAYCDQDDIWMPGKINALVELMQRTKAKLVCSDVIVIDVEGNRTASSITNIRKRHVFYTGKGLAESLLLRNFVIGCTMLLELETAQEARPFPKDMVHDHWLALFASVQGEIAVSPSPLIFYRIHDNNQTGMLAGIHSREDYYQKRIVEYLHRLYEIRERLPSIPTLDRVIVWVQIRQAGFWRQKGSWRALLQTRKLNRSTSYFELIFLRLPESLFCMTIDLVRRGLL